MLSVHEMKCEYPLFTIIKFQAIARGFLARNRVKNLHGYSCKVGINSKPTPSASQLSPQELSIQRERIRKQHSELPPFEYGIETGEDGDRLTGVKKIKKSLIRLPDGSEFDGEWYAGKRHGRGKQVWKDGTIYEGYWLCDQTSGRGRMIDVDGSVFEGYWKNDMTNGKGRIEHLDGQVYDGHWQDNRYHGEGKETYPDGAIFEGTFKNG